MIDISNLSFHIGKRTLLEDASAFIAKGQKVGLVGLNGCGKTTLFKLILGKLNPDGGAINIGNDVRLATVEQELTDIEQSLLDYVLNSDKELKALYDELKANPSGKRIAEIFDRLDFLGAHSASARASAILSGLGFKTEDLQKPLKEFSGGWRVRAALAAALFTPCECLLLDEPTNHLDLETTIWLENCLERIDKTLIIISHDRNILNKVCDKIILVDECKLKAYNGNYDIFERTRNLQTEQIIKDAEKFEERRKHLQSFVDRFRYKATKAKQAQSRIKMIEKMGDAPKIPVEKSVHFCFPQPTLLSSYLFTMENAACGYGEKRVLSNLNLSISPDDKVALLGANGNGKSTLAKVLAGRLLLQDGKMTHARKLKIAYFAQHQADEFDPELTPFETARPFLPEAKEAQVYTHLASFGLEKSKADTKIGKLSGGEKSRLLLSLITVEAPHVLILDEPTNHLDITSRGALIEALNEYEGAVILVTHDFNIIESVCDRLVLVGNGGAQGFEGDIEDYKNYVLRSVGRDDGDGKRPADTAKDKRRSAAQMRAQQAPLRAKLKDIEHKLDIAVKQKANLEKRLITRFSNEDNKELAFINKEIADLESSWMETTEKLEV